MAKTKAPSKNSRAARRAPSPPPPTGATTSDSSAHASPAARQPQPRPSVLAAHRSATIQKKKTKPRKAVMSARARRRHERGLDMAEAVGDRTASKLGRSLGRQRVVEARRKTWDHVNKLAAVDAAAAAAVAANRFDVLDGDDDDAPPEKPARGAGEPDAHDDDDDDEPMTAVAARGHDVLSAAQQQPSLDLDDDLIL